MKQTRVLVVDDEPQIRRALRAGLHANGFEVELAADGEAALDLMALNPAEIVILDLGLPGIDGIEVIQQLREWSTAPIIVVSVRDNEREKVRALDAGADDYLTKPFGMDELLARVRVGLRHAAGKEVEEPLLEFGDLRIDLARRVVSLAGEEIHLTPTEYDLLRELATNAGRVLTHQMLLSRVWGPASAESVGYLRVYVNQLRHKIELNPGRPHYILTEPGVGYRFRLGAMPPSEPPVSRS